ncbi:MAG: 3-deoxy-7-phosphoheptulonate synthase [Verrucomicrobia bacterium]|nr:3-deoxy-7-phosphoheptulonate synthase [Verrucomicrobiota bacterium]MDA1067985.1 3-deoxy-7-phosphoheptulonate synthase [Verrucomicrobiota bacterium]
MEFRIDDIRIAGLRPLLPPAILLEDFPLSERAAEKVSQSRKAIADVFHGRDDRLVVVVGPCSIHDVEAALEYAEKLRPVAERLQGELVIAMRVYFEKPRTVVGWKGLINDPFIDNSFQINKGLRMARKLLLDVNEMGLPCTTEFLDTITPQFIADLISWGAIGARTTESQVHRELASGMSMPIGFKNGTAGSVRIAVDAISSASQGHWFNSVTKQGVAAIFETTGNPDCHLILRGGSRTGTNYQASDVSEAIDMLEASGVTPHLMIDCSHANSGKDHGNQPIVAKDIAGQISGGNANIAGVMLESHLVEGKQSYEAGKAVYGQSITDACLSLEHTIPVLEFLAEAIKQRRVLSQ